jgi:teichuronic acid exporter
MTKPIASEVISSVKLGLLLKLTTQILSWFATIYIIRLLTPDDYTILSYLELSIATFLALGLFGTGPVIIKNQDIKIQTVQSLLTLVLSINFLFVLLLFFSRGAIASYFNAPELLDLLLLGSLFFLINPFLGVYTSLFAKDMRFKVLEKIQFITTVVVLISNITFAYLGYGFWALIIGRVLGCIVQLLMLVYVSDYCLKLNFNFKQLKPLFRDSKDNFIAGFVWELNQKIDKFFIAKFLDSKYVGMYSMSYALTEKPVSLTSVFIQKIGLSSFSKLQKEPEKINDYIIKSTLLISICFIPIFSGISSIADNLIPLLIGEKWNDAIFAIQILCFVQIINILKLNLGSALFALGHAKRKIFQALVAFCLILVAWILGVQYSFEVACSSYLIGYIIWFLWFVVDSQKLLKFDLTKYFQAIIRPLSLSLIMFFVIFFGETYLEPLNLPILELCLQVVIGFTVYLVFSYVLNKQQVLFTYRTILNKSVP